MKEVRDEGKSPSDYTVEPVGPAKDAVWALTVASIKASVAAERALVRVSADALGRRRCARIT